MKSISRETLLLCLLLAPLAQGAAPATAPDKDEPLDTVLVEGTRAQLNEILHEMVLSEDRFFERYNELNTNHDFDMHCAMEARIGTAMRGRACRAVYMNKAFETEGHDHVIARGEMCSDPNCTTARVPWSPPTPPTIVIEARRKDFQQNMKDVVKRNPELVEMLKERDELGKRYEAIRRKIWGLKPLPDESQAASAEANPP